jgi:hypothetical protein
MTNSAFECPERKTSVTCSEESNLLTFEMAFHSREGNNKPRNCTYDTHSVTNTFAVIDPTLQTLKSVYEQMYITIMNLAARSLATQHAGARSRSVPRICNTQQGLCQF